MLRIARVFIAAIVLMAGGVMMSGCEQRVAEPTEAERAQAVEAALSALYGEEFEVTASERMLRPVDGVIYYSAQAHSRAYPEVPFSATYGEADGRILKNDYKQRLAEYRGGEAIIDAVNDAFGVEAAVALSILPSSELGAGDIMSGDFPGGHADKYRLMLTLFFAPEGFELEEQIEAVGRAAQALSAYRELAINIFYLNGELKDRFEEDSEPFISFEATFNADTALKKGELHAYFAFDGSADELIAGGAGRYFSVREVE